VTPVLDLPRCAWAQTTPELRRYHDEEYGVRVKRPQAYFERLVLEIFQAGLSWRTVLAKRRAFRKAFADFSPKKIAAFTPSDVRRLLADPGIIRNRLKISAAVKNAAVFMDLSRQRGGFEGFLQSLPLDDPAATVKAFRRRFTFMGPKIVEEFLRSTGHWSVSHEAGCFLAPRAGARPSRRP
jgi:DNA-3-methyladenine glycosylase I